MSSMGELGHVGSSQRRVARRLRSARPPGRRDRYASRRLEALREAPGVALLGPGQRLEPLGDLVEALVAGRLGEARVHLGVLVGLAGDGRLEVVLGRADGHVGHRVADLGEEVEVAEGVARLALGDRAEQRGDVGVALDVGLLGEVEVAAVGLALAGERLLEVVLGLAALEVRHGWSPLAWLAC